ncbi:acyl-CoA thioesterase [Maricaulis salignorans]|uniref:Acyl-CoA thioesterase n=1 Tax=Maricaulis salignorans TaxID=144026 RepID=A0A1G9TP05_9PROT|nr:thioesterase family protein [Maricaulis salignorans]SDM49430.1 Acyl-CoA thioesterase [Maricaulis salignorans]
MHLFDQSTALKRVSGEAPDIRFEGEASEHFKNMIGPYGGWSAAVLAKGLVEAAGPEMELVSITTDFLAGAREGPITLDVACDRGGKNTQFWNASLTAQGDKSPSNRAMGILSRRRDTLAWTEGSRPDAPPPEDCDRANLPMAWSRTVEMRPTQSPPFGTGKTRTDNLSWIRLEPDRPLDAVGLVALADTPTPRLFFVTGKPEMIATVSMTVYLHASPDDYAAVGADYMLIETHAARGGRGFYDQHARIWSRDGRLLATTQQIVWYKTTNEE